MRFLRSVRARVTVGAALIFSVSVAIIGVVIVNLVSNTMVKEAQRGAEVQARNLAIVAEVGRVGSTLDVDAADSVVLQVVDEDSQVVAASSAIDGLPPLMPDAPPMGQAHARSVHLHQHAQDLGLFRIVGLSTTSPSGPITVIAGVSLAEVSNTVRNLSLLLTTGFAAVVALMTGGVWFVVSRALRPVEEIRSEVELLTDAD